MSVANVRLMVTPVMLTNVSGMFTASVTCDECAETAEWRVSRMPPPEIIKKHFVVRGWELRKKPRCPECVKKKEKKMSKAPNLTPVPSSEIVAPSEAARRARRMVYMALEDYYDEAKKAYKPGYSDKKISEETGASETIVSQIRQQDFGPLGPPSEFAEIYASVTELKARLDKLAVANGWSV